MSADRWGLHWFRRDLRIAGNEALRENWKRTGGRTLGVFCFDSKFLSRSDFSPNRFAFFLETIEALRRDWREQGGDLLVVDSQPIEFFSRLTAFVKTHKLGSPDVVTWNRDYEPFARARDSSIESLLQKASIPVYHARDHLLFEPKEIMKSEKSGDFYQIYSPYAKKWFAALGGDEGAERLRGQRFASDYYARNKRRTDLFKMSWSEFENFPFLDACDHFVKANSKNVTVPIPEAGFFVAYKRLKEFRDKLNDYKEQRDFPSIDGTSRFSHFLKNGSLTTTQILNELKLESTSWYADSGATQFVKELAWREFYYSILFHRPDVEHNSFLKAYENLNWENDESHFQRWCDGTTGFPIVDAGMRELKSTGWMHNRVRMIVASFLTKDLLIDWRWGENHFMKFLLDGDLAANNGGWQWAASTGCDPQPYFRIFNPWLQGKKFDPDATYIRTYVPELREAPTSVIHDPDGERSRWKYPKPIVDHAVQRDRAIRLYDRR